MKFVKSENDLVQLPRLIADYYTLAPDPEAPGQRIAFGTSGHRGSAGVRSFNEAHILAIAQAIAEYRREKKIDGPLFVGMDTHALSEPALRTALEVFAANDILVRVQPAASGSASFGYTPTPVVSHAICCWNRPQGEKGGKSSRGIADGVVITPSHNPPEDGGFKYNPPSGGPASTEITRRIETRANELVAQGLKGVKRVSFEKAVSSGKIERYDYVGPYVRDLANIVDVKAIAAAGLRIGADPMGGSGFAFWEPIAEMYGLDITVTNPRVDFTFSFMPRDWDGKIRMDCSSPYAMANLLSLKDQYDIAFGNDTDYDRHGIVTPAGLMTPNAYLAVAVEYLFTHRPEWNARARVGKTLVSSSMIDRVAASVGRTVCEVPVGFKWFVDGLLDGSFGFGGEESAGASFLRRDGTVWTTDKDGIIMDLLACEILAVTGKSPSDRYDDLTARFGVPHYARIDAVATPEQKARLKKLAPENVKADTLAGDPITARLVRAPGNDAAIDGLKVVTDKGWFAARPSGTEDVYKIYAESFESEEHLKKIQAEAKEIVAAALK